MRKRRPKTTINILKKKKGNLREILTESQNVESSLVYAIVLQIQEQIQNYEIAIKSQIRLDFYVNNIHEKMSRFWLAERIAFQLSHWCKKCNTSANYTAEDNGKSSKPMISSETMTRILYGKFERSFLECGRMASRTWNLSALPPISNHMALSRYLVHQFEINLRLWVFRKAEIAFAEAARAISALF